MQSTRPCEEAAFKVRFGTTGHVVGDEHKHMQAFDVGRAAGAAASRGADGDLIITG